MEGSSMKTSERLKREEMFECTARFILALRRPDVADEAASSSGVHWRFGGPRQCIDSGKGKDKAYDIQEGSVVFEQSDLLGYCSFRFDTEETQGPKDAEVIYWWV